MLWAQSTTKDYTRAEQKLQSISKLIIPQVIIPQVFFLKPQFKFYPQFRNAKPEKRRHVLEPICILRVLNMKTCIQQGDLFYSGGLLRKRF